MLRWPMVMTAVEAGKSAGLRQQKFWNSIQVVGAAVDRDPLYPAILISGLTEGAEMYHS
jgi:hypothetical protein